ncbi:type III polyketide synthase [soil metagenome]
MTLHILGIGTAVPPFTLTQERAADLAATYCVGTPREEKLLRAIYRKVGIETRQVVLSDAASDATNRDDFYQPRTEDNSHGPSTAQRMAAYLPAAFALALQACRAALAESQITAAEITHLITVSCTGFAAPGVDVQLIEALSLPRTVRRLNIGFMGCHGALNGLQATQAAAREPGATVLLCCVELCSLHLQYGWRTDQVMANALFGDGSAAIVAKEGAGDSRAELIATGSCLIPETQNEMGWRISDHGFEMTLSAHVPDLLKTHLRAWLISWLEQHGVDLAEVANWVIHPGGPRIISAVEECLSLPPEAGALSREILRTHGNMSSPTVLFILQETLRKKPRGTTVMLAFGPGLSAEAALFR